MEMQATYGLRTFAAGDIQAALLAAGLLGGM